MPRLLGRSRLPQRHGPAWVALLEVRRLVVNTLLTLFAVGMLIWFVWWSLGEGPAFIVAHQHVNVSAAQMGRYRRAMARS